jgi:sec-independent protein translocase protein TatB
MFDVSFPEFVLCAIIGLLVLGPQRLPKVAAEIGKWVGKARRTATQLRRQLEREIELSELEKPKPPPPSTPPTPTQPAPSSVTGAQSGEVPPGPGTHADQPELETTEAPNSVATPQQRAEQTPPS